MAILSPDCSNALIRSAAPGDRSSPFQSNSSQSNSETPDPRHGSLLSLARPNKHIDYKVIESA